MTKIWKRTLAFALCLLMVLGTFSACGGGGTGEGETSGTTETTQPGEEGKTLKILTLGHSLAVDCGHMLAMIADKEGYEGLEVATLYYSGCRLSAHVSFLTKDSAEYDLYISSTETASQPPEIMENVTMKQALTFDYWDIIIMQGGAFEIAEDDKYKNGNIQTIQNYVNEHKLNPGAVFAWHMPWALPTDNSLRDTFPRPENNTYYTDYVPFGDNRTTLYNCITQCVKDNILPDETFKFLIPSGTAIENALSSYLEEKDLHRDYAHATDLGRVIASYSWYCKLAGIDKLEEIKLDAIPKAFFKSTQLPTDRVLTDMEKAIILESVNNALAEPLKMTQSQYTEAPAQ